MALGWIKSLLGWWGKIRGRRDDWNLSQHIQGPRRDIFEGLREIRDAICATAAPDLSHLSRLHKLREDSVVVFDDQFASYVEDWIKHAAALHTAHGVLSRPSASEEERAKHIEADHAALKFFAQQHVDLSRRVKRYIGSK